MLIYIHVPFCRTKCKYCSFNSEGIGKGAVPAELPRFRYYVDSLFLELAVWGERYGGAPVNSVFFGGGTPSLVPPKIVSAVLSRIAKYFKLSPGAEITLEGNPDSLSSRGIVYEFMRAGINRFSIGLQTLDEEMLRMIGRSHRARDSFHAVHTVRNAGAQNINVDLIWGLPGQGVRHWMNTLKEVVRMKPDHLSCYGLTLEPGTPLYEEREQGLITLPSERDQSVMYMEGAEFLESMGYLHYEISNFSRMGFQCRHNLGYWEGEEYLGIGPSATSTIGGRRWTNPADMIRWMDAVDAENLDAEAEELSPQSRVLELMMLRLRTARGMRVKAYKELTGRDFFHDHKRLVRALHENGLIRIRDGYLRLTRSGMLVSNSILANLFEQAGAKLLPEAPNKPKPVFVECAEEQAVPSDSEIAEVKNGAVEVESAKEQNGAAEIDSAEGFESAAAPAEPEEEPRDEFLAAVEEALLIEEPGPGGARPKAQNQASGDIKAD